MYIQSGEWVIISRGKSQFKFKDKIFRNLRFRVILLVMLGVTVLVSVLDYVVPAYLTKVTGGTKYAERGALAGLIIGAFIIPPFGMIILSFVGAFVCEIYYASKNTTEALKSAFGSFLGFIVGTGLKLMACGIMLYYIIVYMA